LADSRAKVEVNNIFFKLSVNITAELSLFNAIEPVSDTTNVTKSARIILCVKFSASVAVLIPIFMTAAAIRSRTSIKTQITIGVHIGHGVGSAGII
jgi:hypothetical protein